MAKKSSTVLQRFNFYDHIEVLTATDYAADFPLHFHDTVCVTLVIKGFECTQVRGQELISPVGSISLTNACEAHANPNLNQAPYSFITYYFNPEIIQYFTNKKEKAFVTQVIQDEWLYYGLMSWKSNGKNEASITPILKHLIHFYTADRKSIQEATKDEALEEAICFMDTNWNQKLSIEKIAQRASRSKYSFIRAFKKIKGITPAKYIVIKRLETAKQLLKIQQPIIEVAYECGFFDQSHFSNYFKQHTGLTPLQYQVGCNILQD